jgi:UDP-N-acetylmuramate-alanine ligase
MTIEFEKIQDKQRIIILGNEGTEEITKIAIHVLDSINKPADYIYADGKQRMSNAPIILIQGDDSRTAKESEAEFLQYKHHIALIHHIKDDSLPQGYDNLEDYVAQYEKLAKKTPKGGSIFYNKEDDLATVIGSQDYEDVRLTEYKSLNFEKTADGFKLPTGATVKTSNANFPSHASGVKELLFRISVQEDEFYNGLKTYKD